MKSSSIIEIRSELCAGTRGSSSGPFALRIADQAFEARFAKWDENPVSSPTKDLYDPGDHPKAKRIEKYIPHIKNVKQRVSESLGSNQFPIVISGDHSNAYGTIAGIKDAIGDKRLGVIWIDAHADLHTPFTTPSGNMHGMPLGMAIQRDYPESAETELEDKWQEILDLSPEGGAIRPEDIVFIGVRDAEPAEMEVVEKSGVRNFLVSEVREQGALKIAEQAINLLKDVDHIYISFDVDSMDPNSVSRGTGTPVENGLELSEAIELNKALSSDDRVICWEMTEVNPLLDEKNKMAKASIQVLYGVDDVLKNKA